MIRLYEKYLTECDEFGWELVRKDRATRICAFFVEIHLRTHSYGGEKQKLF